MQPTAPMSKEANGNEIGVEVRAGAEATVRRSGTSFYWAMRFLPEPRRASMYAVYAFCREIDDIADGHRPADEKLTELAAYRKAVAVLFEGGTPGVSAVQALGPVIGRYGLDRADLDCVIDGMETDAAGPVRMADKAALMKYIDQVACSVGRLSCRIFELPVTCQRPLSEALGEAFQLTNILRDLRDDAHHGRVYLPGDLLVQAGYGGIAPLTLVDEADLTPLCAPLVDWARARFAAADAIIDANPSREMRPVRMMRAAYGRLFDKVAAAGFAPLPDKRVSLGKREKFAIVLRQGIVRGLI